MDAGKLNRPVKIKYPEQVGDGMGGYSQIWVDFCDCRAAIEPMTAKEVLYSGQRQELADVKITIRWRTGIKPAWRIYDGNTVYAIDSIINIKTRNQELQIIAKRLESESLTATIAAPTITAPLNEAEDVSLTPVISCSAFTVSGGTDTHHSTTWQITALPGQDWSNPAINLTDSVNLTSMNVPSGALQPGTAYAARIKYTGRASGSSAWSGIIVFTTAEAQP